METAMSVHPKQASALPQANSSAQPFILQGSDQFGKTGQILPIYYPGDQATRIGEYYCAEELHIELIERTAEQGFQAFRHSSPNQRANILNKLSQLLEAHHEPLATLITQECGKPIKLSRGEVDRAIQTCRAYANEVERQVSPLLRVDEREARIGRFPIGPVLAITPYNFPLNLVVHKLAPAIAAGCSITIKPAPKTPLTALYLGRLAIEAGYEAISVIPASNEVAEALVRSNAFAKLSFTGSAKVGWYLQSIAGKKSVTLELGGNAALVIEDLSRPVADMAQRAAYGAFAYSGQICISIQRILINERVRDDFMTEFVMASRALKVGDPMKVETDLGPMITMEDVQRTRRLIKSALREGANVIYGGNTFNALTMNPTILDRTTPEMAVNAEEVFAPIVTVTPYAQFEEALALVNQSPYGLQAGVYTNSYAQAELAYNTLDVGGVIINDIPTYRADILPYGGIKDSGIGREGALVGIDEYSYLKTLIRQLDEPG
jgi:acyl-CoA reductase-like NAD-dependent aldehyde dehydrogenase